MVSLGVFVRPPHYCDLPRLYFGTERPRDLQRKLALKEGSLYARDEVILVPRLGGGGLLFDRPRSNYEMGKSPGRNSQRLLRPVGIENLWS